MLPEFLHIFSLWRVFGHGLKHLGRRGWRRRNQEEENPSVHNPSSQEEYPL